MPIDISTETLAPLAQASNRWVPTRPHVATVRRWAVHGIRGHKLDTIRIGGITCTSQEAIGRFLSAINGHDVTPANTSHQREQEIARAERELAAAGVH